MSNVEFSFIFSSCFDIFVEWNHLCAIYLSIFYETIVYSCAIKFSLVSGNVEYFLLLFKNIFAEKPQMKKQ